MSNLTGHGPRRLFFDGDERNYEVWEAKFLGFLRIRGLHAALEKVPVDSNKNAEIFAELLQVLDDRSINLIIRDARDDGKKALDILNNHYKPKGKPRILTLYTQLTSLKKQENESVTDYIIKAETISYSLIEAGETISDSLQIAMVMKGLPNNYQPFCVVINQKDKAITFSEFKVLLRNFEDNENIKQPSALSDSVMEAQHYKKHCMNPNKFKKRWCSKCKSNSHDTKFCKRFCTIHQSDSHWTSQCRKGQHSINTAHNPRSNQPDDDSNHSHEFAFMMESQPKPLTTTCAPTVATAIQNHVHPFELLVDSGASSHIIINSENFITFNDTKTQNHVVELANGEKSHGVVEGQGNATIVIHDEHGQQHEITLKNALYIPSFRQNIFSVPAATSEGASIKFNKNDASLVVKNNAQSSTTTFPIEKRKNLYFINSVKTVPTTSQRTLNEWHQILGHCNFEDIIKLENCVQGMHITDKKKSDCETCLSGKMTQTRNRRPDDRATKILQKVHLDLAGPIDPPDREGFRYALVCVDDYSGLMCVYLLKNKSDTTLAFRKYLSDISPYGQVKSIRTDNGGEFLSKDFEMTCITNKIKHEKSSPHSPHQNGTGERHWRTLFEMSRCLLISSQLPKMLWSYALMYSTYIRNRCFNNRLAMTPFEAFTRTKPNISKMQPFGSECFAYVQNPKKLDARSKKGIFIGFDKGSPASLIYFPEEETVKKIRIVKFLSMRIDEFEHMPVPIRADGSEPKHAPDPTTPVSVDTPEGDILGAEDDNEKSKSQRHKSRPKYLNDYVVDDEIDEYVNVTTHYCYHLSDVPKSYSEAMSGPHAHNWQKAMMDEMRALEENETFDLVPLPEGRKAIGGKWVYAIKTDKADNEIYKARFVARGFSQIEGLDYEETFSPTAHITSIRILAQTAIQNDLDLHQMDVKAAYLNSPIDCEIFVNQPEGFECKGKETQVYRLKKSLYGLKQSGRNWNNTLHTFLIEQDFKS